MKKLMYLMMAGFVMAACSVDPVDANEDFDSLDSKTKATATTQTEEFVVPELICAGEPAEFAINAPVKSNLQVQQWNEETEEWEQVFQIAQSTTDPHTFSLEFETAGDYDLRYKADSGGFTDVTVTVENCDDCSNELIADLTCGDGNTLVLTFTAEEAGWIVIQGGLNHNTEILNKSSNVLSENETHPSVVNSNANVTRWEGNVEACEEVTITIEFEGVGYVDDWSAKRGDGENEEVLGETEAQSCD